MKIVLKIIVLLFGIENKVKNKHQRKGKQKTEGSL